jgi:RNA polymerase sigma-70 factor (ECF subfamily)
MEQIYASYKSLLFSLAYRMLGSVMDAEDIVQETFLSLNRVEPEHITNMKAYLCKMATNRCIDRLRSAQKQREVYIGPWLPEPLVTEFSYGNGGNGEGSNDPVHVSMQNESLSTAYLLLLQQLSWVERAVFLLREVLQYDYDEIAGIVGKSSANCRQIFHRAKRSLGGQQPHLEGEGMTASPVDPAAATAAITPVPAHNDRAHALANQFVQALAAGDMSTLLKVLSADAALYSDGGGKVTAAVHPILGAERITRFLAGLLGKLPAGFSYKTAVVNGLPGIITYVDGNSSSVFSLHIEGDCITAIYIVVNPDKLMHIR